MSQERSRSGSEGARVCRQGTLCPQVFVSTPVPWTRCGEEPGPEEVPTVCPFPHECSRML